jgi:VWA domain containing CoxE-like protein
MPATSHLNPATAPSAPTGSAPDAPWLAVSAALTASVPPVAGRDDLNVTCAPGAGRGAPGCFLPALAAIEVDGANLGVDPATADPARPSDRERYPALWGVLTHEAAHAAHSRWTPPTGTAAAWASAALMLEESRIEAAHLARRPGDRHWLRAAATKLILDDFAASPAATAWEAARAAALLAARADSGVLDPAETAGVAAAAEAILGPARLDALRSVWRAAHAARDTDAKTMTRLGRRWCRILGTPPDTPRPEDAAPASGPPSPLAEAITEAVGAITAADAPAPALPAREAARAAETAARRRASAAASKVFADDDGHGGGTGRGAVITGTRPPAETEKAAARRLARAMRAAAIPGRTPTVITSAAPPGRLRMRQALARDAQRAAGAVPTAEPFSRVVRRRQPVPPLRVGIACDVSGSMGAFAGPVASAAWILAHAAAAITGTRTATVIYGDSVRPVTRPGRAAAHVTEFAAVDGTEKFCQAVDALDAALDLARTDTARLLVIVSDGRYTADERAGGQQRLTRLTRAGCGIIWLAPDGRHADPMPGAHVAVLADPAATADAIARAAARALADAT